MPKTRPTRLVTTLAPTPPAADGAACAVMLICARRSVSASVRAHIVKVMKGASIRAQIEVKVVHSAWIRAHIDSRWRIVLESVRRKTRQCGVFCRYSRLASNRRLLGRRSISGT